MKGKIDGNTQFQMVNEHEAEAVKLIFDMVCKGAKYPEVAEALNSRGYRTRTGKEFSSSGLHEILVNQKYIGRYIYNKRVTQSVCNSSRRFKDESEWIVRDDVFPPLISAEVFYEVQKRLAARKVSGQAHAKETYLLSGKICCGVCGTTFCGERRISGKGSVTYHYFCNKRHRIKSDRCTNPSVNRAVIESFVLEKLSVYVFSDEIIPTITESCNRYLTERNGSYLQKLRILNKELNTLECRINAAVDALLEMRSDAVKQRLTELEARKSAIKSELAKLAESGSAKAVTEDGLRKAFAAIRAVLQNGTLANIKQLVEVYVHEVVVYPEKVVVVFNLFPHIKLKRDNEADSGADKKECPEEGHSFVIPEGISAELKRDEETRCKKGDKIIKRVRS